jgi:type IV pilus assembly protein PilQ
MRLNIRRFIFLGLLVALLGEAGPACADLGVDVAPSSSDPQAPITDQLIQFKDLPSLIKNPTFVTWKYVHANVRDILQDIARQGGMNLLMDDSVTGRFDIDVRAMPLDEVFDLVMRLNGLAARRVGTSLLVATEAELKKKLDSTQAVTVRLNNATSDDALKMVKDLVDKETKVISDPRTNSILVVGTADDVAKVRNTLRALDVPTPQVSIEIKMVELKTGLARSLGGQFGFGGSKFGLSNGVQNPSTTSNGAPTAGIPATPSGSTITFAALGNYTSNFTARLDALISTNQVKVLANPRIATQDSHEATMNIVNQFPILKTTLASGPGGAVGGESIEFKPIGQQLTITPHIDVAHGYVTMDLAPTISVEGLEKIINGNPVPEIDERSVKTRMRVKDGESVVIGGLIRRDATTSVDKMPLLGDLPGLGFLFKSEHTNFIENEVIIIVTPHITNEVASPDS